MQTVSINASSIKQLTQQIDHQLASGFQPTIAMVFSAPELPYQELPALFKKYDIALVGCTTMKEISNSEILSKSFSVLLMDMNKEYFDICQLEYDIENIAATAKELGQKAIQSFDRPGIILYSGGMGIDGEKLVNEIKKSTSIKIPLYGGLAGDGTRFEKTYCFSQEGFSSMGVAAIIVDSDKIRLNGLSYSGWEELGATHKITKAVGNIVYEINNKPALEEFEKYFGKLRYNLSVEEGGEFEVLAGQFPLKILKQHGVSVLRSVIISDLETKSLVLAGSVQEGETFQFCTSPSFEVVDKTIDEIGKLKNKLGDIDAVVMISCAARLSVFGPMLEDEISEIYNLWKQPMIGYFSYGEIGNTNLQNDNCEFHNVTCSLVTITER